MGPQRSPLVLAVLFVLTLLSGCTEDTADLKQKMADMEKRLQKQEKDLREFAGKFAPPKDFSADLQRMEDQQERITQAIKTKVDPVNAKLEEFRDWAQEAQKEREGVAKRLKGLEQSIAESQKRFDAQAAELVRMSKESAGAKKVLASMAQRVDDLSKVHDEMRKEVTDSSSKLLAAVKKVLPKIKEAAVAEVKEQLNPLQENLNALKTGVEADRKNIAAIKESPASGGKEVKELSKRVQELEDVIVAQKSFLLEIGSKLHEMEMQIRRLSAVPDSRQPKLSQR
jgi:chromosome segregation ATPase